MHEDLGLVVNHVECSVFLSHLNLEDTVERMPSRHLALSLCTEDVKAQCDSLTPQTVSRGKLTHERFSGARTRLSQNQSKSSFAVHHNVPVRSEAIHEPETDPFSGPADPCDSVTDELDVDPSVSKTRKRRRLLHKSPVFARLSWDDCDEDDDTSAQVDCFMPAFAKNFDEKRPVVGTVCSTGLKVIHFLLPWKQLVNPTKSNLRDMNTPSKLLEKGGAGARLPAVFETDDTTAESCQQGKFLGWSTVADVQRNSSSFRKGQRRNLSSMTKVLSMIFAAAQFLDSSCADCWNRAVRFGRPDLLEMCASSDSSQVDAVESAGREGLRASFWNGYGLTTRRACSVQRRDQDTHGFFVTLSSFWSVITTCVSHSARDCRCLSERASTWLSCPFPTTTQFGQLEPEIIARHGRKDVDGSRRWLRVGVFVTRKEVC